MEKSCLLVDCGSGYCKAGYSGYIEPTVTIPTIVWHPQSNNMITTDDQSSLLFGYKGFISYSNIKFMVISRGIPEIFYH